MDATEKTRLEEAVLETIKTANINSDPPVGPSDRYELLKGFTGEYNFTEDFLFLVENFKDKYCTHSSVGLQRAISRILR